MASISAPRGGTAPDASNSGGGGAGGAGAGGSASSSVNPQRLLWNPENVKDVAESVGVTHLGEEALRNLAQDVEYRIGQVVVEGLRIMRAAKRTTLTVQDMTLALRVLDVEPLYGYASLRPLRYGEASLGPGQPLFYIEDEEVDFEKLINAPLPKVPRDTSFTSHWLAIEGTQPSIPQNPSITEARSQELLPKGPLANPALPALAGNQSASFRPSVKHVLSTELTLYFEKVQAALLDESPELEVQRLRESALNSVATDPGIQQLIPYFIEWVAHEVTHHIDDIFVLRQMMELTNALISNPAFFADPYASPLSVPVLTCLLGRKLGFDATSLDALKDQYQLRELASSLVAKISRRYAGSNRTLRPKLVRSCLKAFLDPDMPPAVWYGSVLGVSAAGGPESVKVLLIPVLKTFETSLLPKINMSTELGRLEYEAVMGALMKVISTLESDVHDNGDEVMTRTLTNGSSNEATEAQVAQLKETVGDAVGERLIRVAAGKWSLIEAVLDARHFN